MKKITSLLLTFLFGLSTLHAQKGIDFSRKYAAGGKLLMSVDSLAKNVFYWNVYPNQPLTSFNYLPDVNNFNIQVYFRKKDQVQNYRYTIIVDDKPIIVNQSINQQELQDVDMPDETFKSTTLGTFPIKGKIVTTIMYDIEKPLEIYKNVFYGKPIPKAKIKNLAKRTVTDKGVDYSNTPEPKETTNLFFSEKDDELTIVKDRSDIDYIYRISIRDKQTDKTIYTSSAWQYGGYVEDHQFLPYVKIDKSTFRKSGDYEIIIQPFINGSTPLKDIESCTTIYTLSITLDEENYTKKELFLYGLILSASIGLVFLIIIYALKKRNKRKLAENDQQKHIAKLQLSSIRSQLNPHFLFNALSGIQNLMNKNEIDNANKYLAKFARLTRNILNDKDLISLSQEKRLLDDYLQMEQLRFGFEYEIIHSENLNLDNTEIPSMLLQPFVENAVKHGISQQGKTGKITVIFGREERNLSLIVTDNGNGFDPKKKNEGLGLNLSDSRVALLNNIYKENRFTLVVQSTTTGTKISLTLTDWL